MLNVSKRVTNLYLTAGQPQRAHQTDTKKTNKQTNKKQTNKQTKQKNTTQVIHYLGNSRHFMFEYELRKMKQ